MTHHGAALRGLAQVTESPLSQGRFGRLFRNLPAYKLSKDGVDKLAPLMIEPDAGDAEGWDGDEGPSGLDHPDLPAGYTYLGQFIDHDLTFEPTSQLDRENDPDALRNFRTPRFDLDSVYGRGPHDQPYMYDGHDLRTESHDGIDDLPRYEGRAIIGDPRNDENAIISQLHLLFLKAHNKALREVTECGFEGEDAFTEARRVVRWHYQYVVIHDFLRRIIGRELVEKLLSPDKHDGYPRLALRHYRPANNSYMPLEFSVAAYRFGHSLVRPSYQLNDANGPVKIFTPAGEDDLSGFRPLDPQLGIEWKHFFDDVDGHDFQLARRLDTKLSPGLAKLHFANGASLAALNLHRSNALGLPSGQSVASAMCADRLTKDDLADIEDSSLRSELVHNTPLWFHVLKEAEVRHQGLRLGAVGGRIVGEVFIGLMQRDSRSYLHVDPCWTPDDERSLAKPMASPGTTDFGMGHFIRWASD